MGVGDSRVCSDAALAQPTVRPTLVAETPTTVPSASPPDPRDDKIAILQKRNDAFHGQVQELETQLAAADAHTKETEAKMTKLRETQKQSTAQIEQLQKKAKEDAQLIATLQSRLKECQNQAAAADSTTIDLRTQLAALLARLSILDSTLTEKEDKLQKAVAEAQAAVISHAALKEEKSRLEVSNLQLQSRVEAQEAALMSSLADSTLYAQQAAELKALRQELVAGRQQEAELKQLNAQLSASHKEAQANIETLEAKIEAKEEEINQFTVQLTGMQETLDGARIAADEEHRKLVTFQEEYKGMQAQLADLSGQMETETEKLSSTQNELVMARNALVAAQKELAATNAAKDEADAHAKKLQQELDDLVFKYEEVHARSRLVLSGPEDVLSEAKDRERALIARLEQLQQKSTAESADLQSQLSQVRQELDQVKSLFDAKDTELKNVRDQLEESTRSNQQERELIEQHHKELVQSLQNNTKVLEEKIRKLEATLRAFSLSPSHPPAPSGPRETVQQVQERLKLFSQEIDALGSEQDQNTQEQIQALEAKLQAMTAGSSTPTALTTANPTTTTTVLRHPTLERPKKASIVGKGSLKKFDPSVAPTPITSTDSAAITLVQLTPEETAQERQKAEQEASTKAREESNTAPQRASVVGGPGKPPHFLHDLKSQLSKRKLSTVPAAVQ